MNLPPAPSSVDVLLFDLGRVVLDISFDQVMTNWAGHAGCAPADLAGRFVVNDSFKHHETGRIDDAAFFASLRQSLGIGITDAQFLEGWNAIFTGEMPGIAPLLARRRKAPAALCVFQHQSGPCRAFLAGLCRRARPFPQDFPVLEHRFAQTRRGSL